ncbi:hypothetical protein [Pedobacter sp. FW305-3-2-15-E-R2A2]|jgi:hypothetical protein|uniref:hypothetical protein n=1 Tax=Pedobacter sp. FW305-3-2-15-E-R2A2 TaxID=3140251 RepID=UPI003140A037
MKTLMLSVMTLFSVVTTEYALAGKRLMTTGHYSWEGGYEIGYINRSGQRFAEIGSFKGKCKTARSKNTKIQVLLNKKGEVIKLKPSFYK